MSHKPHIVPYYSVFNPVFTSHGVDDSPHNEHCDFPAGELLPPTYCDEMSEPTEIIPPTYCDETTFSTTESTILEPTMTEETETMETEPMPQMSAKKICCQTKNNLTHLHESIGNELQSIHFYHDAIQNISELRVKKVIAHIANDEKSHFAKHLFMLNRYDPYQAQQFYLVGWKTMHSNTRHPTAVQNGGKMIMHLQAHLLEFVEELVFAYLDEHAAEVIDPNICKCLPKPLQCFLNQQNSMIDLDCIPQPLLEQFAKYLFSAIPESFICQLQKYVQEALQPRLRQLAEEHNCLGLLPNASQQIFYHICNYVLDCVLAYTLRYICQNNNPTPTVEIVPEIPEPIMVIDQELNCPHQHAVAESYDSSPNWLSYIHQALINELTAINAYNMRIQEVEEEDIRLAFCAAMNAEKEHVAQLTQILQYYDQALAQELSLYDWKMMKIPR